MVSASKTKVGAVGSTVARGKPAGTGPVVAGYPARLADPEVGSEGA
jgi:hypothetical protein